MRLFLALLLSLFTGAAMAADLDKTAKGAHLTAEVALPQSWTGVYIGADLGIGHTTASTDGDLGGLDLSGLFAGARVGGDIQAGSGIVVGVWAQYDASWQALEVGGQTVAERDGEWSVNARLGVAHGSTLFYGFGGYGMAYFAAGDEDAEAPLWRAGAGIEHRFPSGLSLGLEYAHSWLDADELIGEGAEDIIDLTDDSVMLVARYRLDAGPRLGIFAGD